MQFQTFTAAVVALGLATSTQAALITGTSVSDFSGQFDTSTTWAAANVANGQGLTGSGHTSSTAAGGGHWLSNDTGIAAASGWIVIDLGGEVAYEVTGLHLWNFNASGTSGSFNRTQRGAANLGVQVSLDGSDWGLLTNPSVATFLPAQAPGTDGYLGESFAFTTPVTANFIRLNINSNHGATNFVGLSEVQFFGTPIPEPMSAGLILLAVPALLLRRPR